jgi:hypothetical protein
MLVLDGINPTTIERRRGDWGTGRKKWYAYFRRLVLGCGG